MYTVKEIANMLNLTEHTIRYYTDQKLVPHLQRDKNNNRIFDESAIKWLLCAKHLRKCGMSIKAIKTYVDLCLKGESTVQRRYDIFKKQEAIAQEQLTEAKSRAQYMKDKTKYYKDILNGMAPDNMNPNFTSALELKSSKLNT